jgi:predicted lipoprotein
MKRIAAIVGLLAAAAVFFWFFPLFHIVRIDPSNPDQEQTAFNAAEFAKDFWTHQLTPALTSAAQADAVLAAINENPQQAREQFGRSVGLGRSYYYYLRGSGTIVSIDGQNVGVSVGEESKTADIVLPTGLLFGNAVRDATGLLDASEFPNSQNFNDISRELNRIVETLVLPPLKEQAKVGRRIHFVGCAEVRNDRDLKPLTVIPLDVKFE